MGDLLAIVTMISGIVTIITGGVTIASFARQRNAMLPSGPAAQAPQPVAVPQQAQPHSVEQAPAGIPTFPRSDAPAAPPLPAAEQPYIAPAIPYQSAPAMPAMPMPSQPAHVRRRFVSYPLPALGGLVAQIFFTIWLVLISQTDASGNELWRTDATVDTWSNITFGIAFILAVGLLIYAIVKTIRLRRWGWLVGSVVGTFAGFIAFSGIALIIFGLWAPTTRRAS